MRLVKQVLSFHYFHDFEVYESRTRYPGLQVDQLVEGKFKPEVTLFLIQKLVSLVHAWYIKQGLENFTNILPRINEIESAENPNTDRQEAFENLPFHESVENKPRVLVIGNSNLGLLNRALESTLEEDIVYVKSTFNIFATDKRHKPPGAPAGHLQTGFGKTKVFHALNTALYDPEYFNLFGIAIYQAIFTQTTRGLSSTRRSSVWAYSYQGYHP